MKTARRMAPLVGLAALTALFAAGRPTYAGTAVVGQNTTNVVFPFSGNYHGLYQQVYAASALSGLGSGSVTISSIAFQTQNSSLARSVTFTYSLSTTSAVPNALSTSYAANEGANAQTYSFSGPIVPRNNGTFDFVLPTAFSYDSGQGNLLLEINTTTPGVDVELALGSDSATSRVFNVGGTGAPMADAKGLLTQFTSSPANVSGVPEPSSVAPFTFTGLLAAGLMLRARKRAAARQA